MKYILNFDETKIRAGERKILVAKTATDFLPDRLEVPSDLARDFEIEGIRVGQKDQDVPVAFPGYGLPAVMFTENAYGVKWNDGRMTIAPLGTNIAVKVRNISKQTKTFMCRVIGDRVVDVKDEKREEEMRQGAAKPLAESRLDALETWVRLHEQSGNQVEESRTEILSMLSRLFDNQISAALIAGGCQPPASEAPESCGDYVLGLGDTRVPADSSATINVQPQIAFRPERLVIPPSIADDFMIVDIKVGKNSQLASTGALPAEAFVSTRSEANRLRMDVAQPSMFVTISVTNISNQDKYFRGAIFGSRVHSNCAQESQPTRQKNLIPRL